MKLILTLISLLLLTACSANTSSSDKEYLSSGVSLVSISLENSASQSDRRQ